MQEPNSLKQSVTYTFKYNSDADSIDLNTLLLSQIHFSTILNEIKNEVASDAELSIRLKPLKKGSIPFDLSLSLNWIEQLFDRDKISYLANIVEILGFIILIKQFLKGEKPTEIIVEEGQTTIIKDGAKITVPHKSYKLYSKDGVLNEALEKSFEAIEKDEEITGLEILDKNKKPVVEVPRDSFSDMSKPNELLTDKIEKKYISANLRVFKVVFGSGYKWQFYLQGRKISAEVKDPVFMSRVNEGEAFAKGDIIEADLEIDQIFDTGINDYIDKDFKVLTVKNHIPRSEQKKLFGGDNTKS